ncbi:MAG: histidine kinase [Steroidobacteraceae bacterium]
MARLRAGRGGDGGSRNPLRAIELQEAERKALARELHDELGQYLNVIKLDAFAAELADLIRGLRPVGLDDRAQLELVGRCRVIRRGDIAALGLDTRIAQGLRGRSDVAISLTTL